MLDLWKSLCGVSLSLVYVPYCPHVVITSVLRKVVDRLAEVLGLGM